MLLSLAAVVSSPASEKPITVPLAGHQICKDATQTSGPCTVKVHGCSGIYKFKLKYEATATDQTSGKVGGSLGDHYDSASGAGGHAVYDLFNNKLTSTRPARRGGRGGGEGGARQVPAARAHLRQRT